MRSSSFIAASLPVHRQAVRSATQVCREGWRDGGRLVSQALAQTTNAITYINSNNDPLEKIIPKIQHTNTIIAIMIQNTHVARVVENFGLVGSSVTTTR